MKGTNVKIVNEQREQYVRPEVEFIELKIERGFAASSGSNESWNETPGGGNF